MPVKSETIFIKIRNADEKKKILKDIMSEKQDVVVKSNNAGGDAFSLIPVSFIRNKLTCRPHQSKSDLEKWKEVILQFSVGHEKYLALCACQTSGQDMTFNMDTEIFKIQRREDFRIRIPVSYKAHFQVKSVNNKAMNLKLPLIDMSAGGCRTQLRHDLFKVAFNDEFIGEINLSRRDGFEIVAQVKHISEHPTDKDYIYVGLQFTKPSGTAKENLVSIMMDLYKELFSKM